MRYQGQVIYDPRLRASLQLELSSPSILMRCVNLDSSSRYGILHFIWLKTSYIYIYIYFINCLWYSIIDYSWRTLGLLSMAIWPHEFEPFRSSSTPPPCVWLSVLSSPFNIYGCFAHNLKFSTLSRAFVQSRDSCIWPCTFSKISAGIAKNLDRKLLRIWDRIY